MKWAKLHRNWWPTIGNAAESSQGQQLRRPSKTAKSLIERAFLSVRQELKRFQRRGLGYSKDLETHKCAVALYFGVYNFARRHDALKTTPAVAAGVELKPCRLEDAVEMTVSYMRRKEDPKFKVAFKAL